MDILTKSLNPQSPITIDTPAERARQAVAKYRALCLDDVYHTLLGIIESESAKGAIGLSVYQFNDNKAPIVEAHGIADRYIDSKVQVRINVAPIIDHSELAKRFEADGFDVEIMGSDDFGMVIDTIFWE